VVLFCTIMEGMKLKAGFTAAEIVVVIAIITIISGIALFNFGGFNEGAALNRSTQELALSIREAQNRALSITRVGTETPPAIGVRLVQDATSYFLFADSDIDGRFVDPPDIKVGSDALMVRGSRVGAIYGYPGGTKTAFNIVHVIFLTPAAKAVFNDVSGNSIGDQIDIELESASGNLTKTITVRVSGQVNIK
jgi:prepilin-type N-terminal cleavage/methylation domain-containing protein